MTKIVYVKNESIIGGLKPECGIEFKNEDGCEYIRKFEHSFPKILYKVGEYKHHIKIYYKEYTLLDMKVVE